MELGTGTAILEHDVTSESHTYCYYFDQSLLEEWSWSERYPGQEEILKYLNFCAQKFDLERDINYNERVVDARWDSEAKLWRIKTQAEKTYCASFLITAVGCLSSANIPTFDGLKNFKGEVYHTGQWPHESVIFAKQECRCCWHRLNGIQAIPEIAKQAKSVHVLQRTQILACRAQSATLPRFHSKFVSQIDVWRSKC